MQPVVGAGLHASFGNRGDMRRLLTETGCRYTLREPLRGDGRDRGRGLREAHMISALTLQESFVAPPVPRRTRPSHRLSAAPWLDHSARELLGLGRCPALR